MGKTCLCMYDAAMRTTIEMDDKHRAALLELAARRGEKGFSALVGEAIDAYSPVDGTRAYAAQARPAGARSPGRGGGGRFAPPRRGCAHIVAPIVAEGFAAVAWLTESVRCGRTNSNALREPREHRRANK